MADGLTPDQISRAFLDAMREYNSGGNLPGAGGAGGGRSTGPNVGPPAADMSGLIKQVKEYTDKVKKGNGALDSYTRMMQLAGGNYVDVSQQLGQMDSAIKKAKDSEDLNTQAKLENTKAALVNAAEIKNVNAALKTVAATTLKSIIAAAPALGNFVKGLQSGTDSNALATGIMGAGIDMAAGAIGGAAAAASGAGTAMAALPGKAGAVGKALSVLGPLVGMAGNAMSAMAKTGLSVMAKEVARTTDTFLTASRSGAIFADGMTGMKNAALGAGLTTEQYSKVLQQNSSTLAAAGVGVAEGTLLLGATMKKGGDSMRREMLNLGYSYEEQGGLVAEVMANMRQSGKALTQGDTAAIADQTRKYAENLRIVSSITGEDAKKKMDQVKAEAQQLAMQQKLAEMDATQRDNVINAMANMSDQQRKNFQETLIFGQVINKEGAALEATSSAYAASTTAMVAAANKGTLDADSARKIIAASSEQIKKDLLSQKEIGMAGMAGVGGLSQSLSDAMGKELLYRNKFNADAIAAAAKATKDAKVTEDKLTTTVTDNMTIAQDLALKMQSALESLLPHFTTYQNKTLSAVQDIVNAVSKFTKSEEGQNEDGSDKDWVEKQMNKVGLSKQTEENAGVGGALKGAASGAMTGAMIGSLVPVVGTAIGAAVGGIIGGALGWFSKGSSDGGIVTGADEGFLHKLHGTELIVPLDSGVPREGSKGYEHAMKLFNNGKEEAGGAGKVVESAWGWAKSALGFGGDKKNKPGEVKESSGVTEALALAANAIPVVGAITSGIKAISSWFGGGDDKETVSAKSVTGTDEEPAGGLLSGLISKVTAIADQAQIKLGLKEDDTADTAVDGEVQILANDNLKTLLEEQLMVLHQLNEHLMIMSNTTVDGVGYQKQLVENS